MNFFKRLFFGKSPRRIEHPVFGEALLIETKRGSYWEVETELAGKPFTVVIETTNGSEPTDEQVIFFERYSLSPDRAFEIVRSLLIPKYEKWTRITFPSDWKEVFEFVGMSVPVSGDANNPWDLTFDCLKDPGGHSFTCSFENGQLVNIQIDG